MYGLKELAWGGFAHVLNHPGARSSRRLSAEAVALRWLLPMRLETQDLRSLLRDLSGKAGRPVTPDSGAVRDAECAVMQTLELLARLAKVRTTCLYRSMIRLAFLRRVGLDVRFVMGVRPGREELVGHAWLELDGRPYGEVEEPCCLATFRYPE